jgi:hypothetical protein
LSIPCSFKGIELYFSQWTTSKVWDSRRESHNADNQLKAEENS